MVLCVRLLQSLFLPLSLCLRLCVLLRCLSSFFVALWLYFVCRHVIFRRCASSDLSLGPPPFFVYTVAS